MSLFYAAASFFAERIRVNSIESGTRDGRRVWIKRRRGSATFTLACANLFFRLAGNPVHALSESRKWQQWEVNSFTQLHGDQYRAFAEGDSAVVAQELPGKIVCVANFNIPPSFGSVLGSPSFRFANHPLPWGVGLVRWRLV